VVADAVVEEVEEGCAVVEEGYAVVEEGGALGCRIGSDELWLAI